MIVIMWFINVEFFLAVFTSLREKLCSYIKGLFGVLTCGLFWLIFGNKIIG